MSLNLPQGWNDEFYQAFKHEDISHGSHINRSSDISFKR